MNINKKVICDGCGYEITESKNKNEGGVQIAYMVKGKPLIDKSQKFHSLECLKKWINSLIR